MAGEGPAEVVSIRSFQKLLLCLAEPMPAAPGRHGAGQARPNRNGGNTSVITDLGRRKTKVIGRCNCGQRRVG